MANRQLGTIEQIDAKGNLRVRLDSGRSVDFSIRKHPHLDYGYAVTSHSAQGATADRVLIHIDSATTHKGLINSRLAYVAVSRARYDARIYTGDGLGLGSVLSRSVSKLSALAREDNLVPAIIEKKTNTVEQPNRSFRHATARARSVTGFRRGAVNGRTQFMARAMDLFIVDMSKV